MNIVYYHLAANGWIIITINRWFRLKTKHYKSAKKTVLRSSFQF